MRIFISYRRSDTRHLAGRLSDILRGADNVDAVFIDVESIKPGADFEREMIAAINASDICLALIGESWNAQGRIHDERDAVRLEIHAALQRAHAGRLNLTPILVDGARMPAADQLPDELKALATRNAPSLSHGTFRSDLDALAQQLGIELQPESTSGTIVKRALAGVGVALAALFLVSLIHKVIVGHSLETSLGSQAALIALFIVIISAGAIVPNAIGWPK